MNFNFSFLGLLILCLTVVSANTLLHSQGDTAIYKTIGGSFEDEFTSVVYDNNSDLVFSGSSSSLSEFGTKAILVKTDTLLNVIWSVSYGEYAVSQFSDLIQDGDTYVAVGSILNSSTSYDMLVAAFNEEGVLLWDKHLGGENWDLANSISIVNGGYLITGSTYNNLGQNALVVKISSSGEILWENSYGGELDEELLDGRESLEGNLIFGGNKSTSDSTSVQWFLKTNSTGGIILDSEFGTEGRNSINSVIADPFEEAYFTCGHFFNSETETEDAFIMGLTSDGSTLFIDTLLYQGNQSYTNIELGQLNELLISGFTLEAEFGNEGKDFLFRAHTRNNIFVNQRTFGSSNDEVSSCAIRINNGFILSGWTDGLGQGQKDGFIIRTRSNGSDNSFSTVESDLTDVSQTLNIETTESKKFFMTVEEKQLIFNESITQLAVYDIAGALVYFEDEVNSKQINLDLISGIYLIKTDGEFKGKIVLP